MIQGFKHLHTYDQKTLPHHFCRHDRPSRIHDHQLVTIKPKDGTRGLQTNSYYYRVIRTWNNLPRILVNAGNINSSKCRLDKAWNNNPSKYDPSKYDPSKYDPSKYDSSKYDSSKYDSSKYDSSKYDSSRSSDS